MRSRLNEHLARCRFKGAEKRIAALEAENRRIKDEASLPSRTFHLNSDCFIASRSLFLQPDSLYRKAFNSSQFVLDKQDKRLDGQSSNKADLGVRRKKRRMKHEATLNTSGNSYYKDINCKTCFTERHCREDFRSCIQ
jgi:hypothetical protein